jgi:hypothetical protein
MLKALSTVAVCASLSGCLDAKKSFTDYETRVVDGRIANPMCPDFTTIPDVNGHFYLGAHLKGTADTQIILLVGDFTVAQNGDGTAKLTYSASALKLPDRVISSGPPAGPHFGSTEMNVSECGHFDAPLKGTLPGDANPVIPGNNAVITGELHGEIRNPDLICGTITGTASGGLSLDGSTFAAVRIPAGTIGAALPATAQFKCPD